LEDFTRDILTTLRLTHDAWASSHAAGDAGTIIVRERQTESSDAEMSGEHLATLLRQVSETSINEIDSLIVELKTCIECRENRVVKAARYNSALASLGHQAVAAHSMDSKINIWAISRSCDRQRQP
jgi:hypothetical protein